MGNYYGNHNIAGDIMLDIPHGRIKDTFSVNKFGSNLLSAAGTHEDIWDGGGVYAWPTTADITHVHQLTNTNPNVQLEIQGLDINWGLIVQTITLGADATVLTTLVTPLLRVFRMEVVSPPTGATADILLTNAGDTILYAKTTGDNNQTLMCMYTVPAGYTAYMVTAYADVVETTGKEPKSTEFHMYVRDNANNYPFQLKNSRAVPKAGTAITKDFKPYLKITEKSDIRISAECDSEPGHVHAGFDLIVIKN
jgi:hypothetical protein